MCIGLSGMELTAVPGPGLEFYHLFLCLVGEIFSPGNKTLSTWVSNVYGHTTLKTPVLVRSPKLSNVGPG